MNKDMSTNHNKTGSKKIIETNNLTTWLRAHVWQTN